MVNVLHYASSLLLIFILVTATDALAAKMILLSAAASSRYAGGIVSAGDFIRVNKNFHSIVDNVIPPSNSEDSVMCIVLRDPLPLVALHHKGPLVVELKEANRILELVTKALQLTTNKEVRGESLYMQGRMHQQFGETAKAKTLYEQAVQLAPDLTLALFGLGQIYLSLKDLTKAAELFGKVRAAHPEDRDTQAYLFLINSLSRQELAPYEKLREVSQGFHYEADLWILQGQLRLRFETEFPIALKCFEFALAALEAHKKHIDPLLLCNIGVLHMALGNVKNAWKFLRWGLTSLETDLKSGRAESSHLKTEATGHVNPVLYGHENDIFYSWSAVPNASVHVISSESFATAKGETYSSALEHSLEHRSMCSFFRVSHVGDASNLFSLEVGDHVIVGDVAIVVQEVFHTRTGTYYFTGKGMISMHPDNPRYAIELLMQKKCPGINFNEKTTSLCYNYARTLEELGHANSAKEIYLNVLKIHPHYLECKEPWHCLY
jgi:tetratricopeptide (TPR) repeat protein